MSVLALARNLESVARALASDRGRRAVVDASPRADLEALEGAGFLRLTLPSERGGLWEGPSKTAEALAGAVRTIARGDGALAWAAAVHAGVVAGGLEAQGLPEWEPPVSAWWSRSVPSGGVRGLQARPGPADKGWTLHGSVDLEFGAKGASQLLVPARTETGAVVGPFAVAVEEGDVAGAGDAIPSLRLAGRPAVRLRSRASCQEQDGIDALLSCLPTAVTVGLLDAAFSTFVIRVDAPSTETPSFEEIDRIRNEVWLTRRVLESVLETLKSGRRALPDAIEGRVAVARLASGVLSRMVGALSGAGDGATAPFAIWMRDAKRLDSAALPRAAPDEVLGR